MDILAENDHRIYGAITIDRAAGFVSQFYGHLFPCLIWDHEGRFFDVERAAVAKVLLEAGCRYAVCGGERCEPGTVPWMRSSWQSTWMIRRKLRMRLA